MTSSKSGVSPSYISACVVRVRAHRHAAVLARGDDVQRRVRVVASAPSPARAARARPPLPPLPTCVASGCLLLVRAEGHADRRLSLGRTYPGSRSCAAELASMLAADVRAPRYLRAPSCSASAPRRLVGAGDPGRVRAAPLVAARRRPWGSRRSARWRGGRCGCRARGPPRSSCSALVTAVAAVVRPATRRGSRRRLAAGPAARARRRRPRLAAVPRRAALRDPRHRAQPRHVAAPVRGRPARRRAAASA